MNRSFSRTGPLLLVLFMIGLDQLTKSWILQAFKANSFPRTILSIFDLVLVWNRGISWGLFNNAGVYNGLIFGTFAGMMSLGLSIWLWRAPRALLAYGLSLIIAGAIGNLIDRIRYGGVVDFLSFHWDSATFPAFNVADAAITIGAALILIDEFLTTKRNKANAL